MPAGALCKTHHFGRYMRFRAKGANIMFLAIAGPLGILTNLKDNMMPPPELINLHMHTDEVIVHEQS
jgi:hypothetical protein